MKSLNALIILVFLATLMSPGCGGEGLSISTVKGRNDTVPSPCNYKKVVECVPLEYKVDPMHCADVFVEFSNKLTDSDLSAYYCEVGYFTSPIESFDMKRTKWTDRNGKYDLFIGKKKLNYQAVVFERRNIGTQKPKTDFDVHLTTIDRPAGGIDNFYAAYSIKKGNDYVPVKIWLPNCIKQK